MAFDSWKDFRKILKEAPQRRSPAGIEKAMKVLVGSGAHTGGNPSGYKTQTKYLDDEQDDRNKISAPPGASGGLEEEVEEETFEMRSELQPEIWRDNVLWPEVRARLLEIVDDFIEGLDMEISVEDVRLTGSLANYNWSKYSDVDVHIVVDYAEIDEDVQLVKSFFDVARARWNNLHDINMYGYEVELYVENVGEHHHSSGIYSILDDVWIVEPNPRDVEIDFATARKKSDDIETQVNLIDRMLAAGKLAASLKSIQRIKQKVRRMRAAGLSSPQKEFSPENIAFKILRRNDTLARLSQMKYTAYDRHMSIQEEQDAIPRN
jgi:predicted nucleotidyltransferase